jgi:hypothetical protein
MHKAILRCCARYESHQSSVETMEHDVPVIVVVSRGLPKLTCNTLAIHLLAHVSNLLFSDKSNYSSGSLPSLLLVHVHTLVDMKATVS